MFANEVNRVRCVLERNEHYLLVIHNNRLPRNYGKWGLPGGVLDCGEQPATGLRRELNEEFQIVIGELVVLGDWEYRDEIHRVFGCDFEGQIEFYDANEILDIAWLTYAGLVDSARTGKLHTGFELEAITEFRNQSSV
jgi:ADP-ribose pyrophosphatase YjhB (NUDIX family)